MAGSRLHEIPLKNLLDKHTVEALYENAQIRTVEQLALCDLSTVSSQTGVSYDLLSSIVDSVFSMLADCIGTIAPKRADFYCRFQFLERTLLISSGYTSLDDLLGGGIFTGQLTEIFGPSSSGKTQLCFSIVANAITAYGDMSVIYVDNSNSFSSRRIVERIADVVQNNALIRECRNETIREKYENQILEDIENKDQRILEQMLSRVFHIKAFNTFALLDGLDSIRRTIESSNDPLKILQSHESIRAENLSKGPVLLVVDSVGALLGPSLGSVPNKECMGHLLMANVSRILKYLAYEYNVAVLYTNYAVTLANGDYTQGLGEFWATVPNTRLLISTERNRFNQEPSSTISLSSFTLVKSPIRQTPVTKKFNFLTDPS